MKEQSKISKWFSSLQTRSSLALLITAAIFVQLSGAIQYFYARNGIRKAVQQQARTEIQVRNLEIQNVVTNVETAVNNMQLILNWSVDNPEGIYGVLETIIRTNPTITGCAIAFEPDYYPDKGHWFEPFAGRDENGNIVHRQIGSQEHDYFNAEWYKTSREIDSTHWTEPYFDDAGSKALVCSYTMPIYDSKGRRAGTFCADVALDFIIDLFGAKNSAYTYLASRTGHLIASPDKTSVMNATLDDVANYFNDSMIDRVNAAMLAGDSGDAELHSKDGEKSYIFYAPVEGNTGWSMAIIFPDKEIYQGVRSVGRILLLLTLVGFAFLMYIMWRTMRGFKQLQTVSAEKERIGGELRIASGIQMGMLPKTFPPYPDRDEVTMAGTLVPAKEVGGDLYDFYIRDEKLFFCVGDVSGKGVPASLVMAVTRSLFRTVSSHEDSPERVMKQMNNAMSEMNESSMFVTLFIGVLDLHTGRVLYCNAGHNPPVLIGKETRFIEQDSNIPVGLMPAWDYTLQEGRMESGDLLFLYTDGLTEAENAVHGQFGEERMMERLRNLGHMPHAVVDGMTEAVHTFVAGAEPSDDLTMLAIQFVHSIEENEGRKSEGGGRSITLQNDVQQVPQLAAFVEEVAEGIGLNPSTAMSLNLAMEEAVVNVMNYAYPAGTQGDIDITACKTNGTLTFTITDSGTPFDPTAKSDPDITLAAEDRPIGGLGIMLVRQLMDEVLYERKDNQNILTLKKKI